jgi:hypothetical protein
MNNLQIIEQTPVEIQLLKTSKELCELAEETLIMSRQDMSSATDLVKTIKTRYKEIEEERTRIVKPFNDGVKAINSRFKAMTQPLEEAETQIKSKMLVFQKDEEKRAREEAARLEKIRLEEEEKARKEAEENSNGDDIRSMPLPVVETAPIEPVIRKTVYGQTGAVSTMKKKWAFELIDIQKLAASRPDLIMIDTVKINAEIRGKGGVIDGLRIFEDDIMQVR